MPSLALVLAHEGTQAMLDDIPERFREDPDIQAILYCHAKEAERRRSYIERVRLNLFATTADEMGMKWWEALLHTTIEPEGETLEQRRSTVLALLSALRVSGTGGWWVETITTLIGPGWSYEELPLPGTVRISLPFPPLSGRYAATEALIRQITDAHLDIVLSFTGGFILDQSQLDQETLSI